MHGEGGSHTPERHLMQRGSKQALPKMPKSIALLHVISLTLPELYLAPWSLHEPLKATVSTSDCCPKPDFATGPTAIDVDGIANTQTANRANIHLIGVSSGCPATDNTSPGPSPGKSATLPARRCSTHGGAMATPAD
jgi:hypothetical protein